MKGQIFLQNFTFLYIFALTGLFFGLLGIAFGIYLAFFRPSSPGELMISKILFLYSIGLACSSLINLETLGTVKKLSASALDISSPSNNSMQRMR